MTGAEIYPRLRALLAELTALPGIAGHEDPVIRFMAGRLAGYGAAVQVDAPGNVLARFGDEHAAPRLAVLAHMDTVGLLVRRVNADGTLGIVPVGGVNWRALPGAAVRVGEWPGVIGVRSQHQARADEPPLNADSLYIQVDPACAAQVEITTPVTYAPQGLMLGDALYCSPYLDNRAGCAVLLELAQRLAAHPPPGCVLLIGTVQEETTCNGAFHALQTAAPDAAFFVDGTLSYDTPDTRGPGPVILGGGPVLTAFLYVSGLNGWHAHPGLRAHLKQSAAGAAIPFQQEAAHGLMSDARVALPLAIPGALIGLPLRGKHAPLETIHLGDMAHTLDLLHTILGAPLPDLTRGR